MFVLPRKAAASLEPSFSHKHQTHKAMQHLPACLHQASVSAAAAEGITH